MYESEQLSHLQKKRNPNFSATELKILFKEVEKCNSVLVTKLSSVTTNNSKKRVCETPIIPKDTREMRRKLETETEKKATKQ